jgi:predicted HicB family RNase H-like nuclease
MARTEEDDVLVQLATRVPKNLHREIKVHCVSSGTSVMQFVVEALEDKLRRSTTKTRTVRGR